MRNIKVIGLGGIGSYLVEPLTRYLTYNIAQSELKLTLIDGDTYEYKNRERQRFKRLGNKAEVTAESLIEQFPEIFIRYRNDFVTKDNSITLIREDDVVFLCVDNHATRKLVSDRCQELDNVTLISGGNNYIDGNVIYYNRINGINKTKPLTELYDSIANPKDVIPGNSQKTEGCETEVVEDPQLLITNMGAAFHMLCIFYAHEKNQMNFEQVYFDISTHRSRPAPERY